MNTSKNSRNLTVLIIDDQMSEILLSKNKSHIFDNLNIKQVTSWATAQFLIQEEGDMGGADILLIDVSFDTDADILKAKDHGLGFLPIGPILALPYIGKRTIMSCIVYSAHIFNELLHKHPYFLISMGLILSRTEGEWLQKKVLHSRYLSSNENEQSYELDNLITDLTKNAASNTVEALNKGVEDYRQRLELSIKNRKVLLTNRTEILSKISDLQNHIKHNPDMLISREITLNLVGNNWKDSIVMSSVFADRIRVLGRWATKEILIEMTEWIESLIMESPIDQALRVIRIQDEADESSGKRIKITDVILNNVHSTTSDEDLDEILRLCILFANVWAMEHRTAKGNITVESIYKRLGDKVDQNIYYSWFDERLDERKKNLINYSRFKRIQYLSTGTSRKDKCFLIANGNKINIEVQEKDYKAIQIYRASEELPKWETSPFKIIPNFDY